SSSRPRVTVERTISVLLSIVKGVTLLARQVDRDQEGDGSAQHMDGQLGALLHKQRAQTEETCSNDETAPIERLCAFLDGLKSGTTPCAIDDLIGNIPVGFAIELEVLAAAGPRNVVERGAIDDGKDRQRRRSGGRIAGRLGNESATTRADANRVNRNAPFLHQRQRLRDFATPGLAVGDENERLRVRRFPMNLFVLVDDSESPVDTELGIGIPARIVLQPEG